MSKEERSESIYLYVTPSVKKELDAVRDNQALKESIIKQFLTTETDWLKDEIKQIDESTVKYHAKLIGIKDAFSKCQDSYVEEIESIYKKAVETFKKLDTVSENTRKNIEYTKSNLAGMLTQISTIDFYKIEKMLEVINKVNSMSNTELDLLKKLLN